MQSQEQINEKSLLNLIEKVNNLLKKFDQCNYQNWQVVMLIGNTGNGKSTIFNFLCGYDFAMREQGKRKVLELSNPYQNGASIIKGGSESVTKEPNYYFNEDKKHLLIDFPGFLDTKGFMTQQVVQVLFNRIVIKTPIKIVYVIKQLDDDLNQRGTELQTFITNCFAQQNKEFHLVSIILNSYMGKLKDQQLISHIKGEMKEIKNNKDIVVIRKIKKEKHLQKYFSEDLKDGIWQIIQYSKPIKFQTAWIKKNSEIAYYINNKCLEITKAIVDEICKSIKDGLQKLSTWELKGILVHYKTIRRLTNKNSQNQQIYKWYYDLIDTCQGIANIFKCDKDLQQKMTNFLKIFEFFAQEDNIIDTQKVLKENSDYIINELISKENTIKYTLEIKQKEQKQFEMIQQLITLLVLLNAEIEKEIREEKNKNRNDQIIRHMNERTFCSIF